MTYHCCVYMSHKMYIMYVCFFRTGCVILKNKSKIYLKATMRFTFSYRTAYISLGALTAYVAQINFSCSVRKCE